MTPYLQDADFTLWNGDVLGTLAGMESESVNCVVTSPPYWGLRDYGTGSWEGGNPEHEHDTRGARGGKGGSGTLDKRSEGAMVSRFAADECSCGARRVDQQLGLEPTPEEYIARMVEVFREVRRVLTRDGTCWVNIGDSYATMRNDHAGGGFGKAGGAHEKATAVKRGWHGGPDLKPKDLVGIPWRLAFALQADGWYLRADVIWSKPNPMPESVTDRPTKAHEYVFLLTKSARYWFDQEAVREPYLEPERMATRREVSGPGTYIYDEGDRVAGPARGPDGRRVTKVVGREGSERWPNPAGRNIRSVWEIATQPYPEAHFATYPEELVRRCVLAGCPEWVCGTCGKPRERIVGERPSPFDDTRTPGAHTPTSDKKLSGPKMQAWLDANPRQTLGFTDCGHNNYQPGTVLDPFMGSGTTAVVARKHNRRCVGIELNPAYCELAARRTQQLTLGAA